eukprot:TRINITY_DN11727_c0_g1_i1.p1 TRINITY_DN11727_c0_g1~~TRINITY_DN11727_c0_g1_i1.p1  ORF type:complete len:143 (+),score=31.85 TRINITY_DN11727_c0_g1_i1:95-523(+)
MCIRDSFFSLDEMAISRLCRCLECIERENSDLKHLLHTGHENFFSTSWGATATGDAASGACCKSAKLEAPAGAPKGDEGTATSGVVGLAASVLILLAPYSALIPVSYTHLRAHETPEHLVCRLLLEKKNTNTIKLESHNNKQ